MKRGDLAFEIGRWLFAAALLTSGLVIGSLDTPVLALVGVSLSVSATLVWWGSEAMAPRRPAFVLLTTGAALTLYTALQAAPLPASFSAATDAHAADIWARALLPFGEAGPAWHPLSLDPTATRVEVLRGLAYLAALLAAVRIGSRRDGSVFLARVVVVASLAVAVVSIAHPAFGAGKVFGVFAPKTGVGAIGPLMNGNHLAAYVNIGAMVALGSAVASRPVFPRAVIASLATLLVAMEVWLGSRGGVGSMVVGILVIGAVRVFGGQAHERRARVYWALTGLAVLGGVGMMVLGGLEGSLEQLKDKDLSKLDVTLTCFREMVPAFPAWGVGRGAFESTFPEFRGGSTFVVFTHPENFPSQWFTEWGIVASAFGLGAIVHALRPRVALSRGEIALGPWVACCVVALHNLVDFNSEVPGVALAAVTCAGIVVAGAADPRSEPTTRTRVFQRSRVLGLALTALSVCAAAVAMRGATHELLDEKTRLHELATTASDADFDAALRGAMLAHPAEPYFPYLGGARALAHRRSVVPWMERTLERAKSYGPAHLVLARSLRSRSPAQARLEYRLGEEQGAGAAPAKELVALVGSFDDALEITPLGAAGAPTLESIGYAIRESRPATSREIDQEILRREPNAKEPTLRVAGDALADVEQGDAAPWCAKSDCVKVALEAAERAERVDPTSSVPYVVHARLSALSGDAPAALARLGQSCGAVADRATCLRALATLAIEQHQDVQATQAIDELSRAGCREPAECASNLLDAVGLEDSRGNLTRAVVLLRRGVQSDPDRVELLASLASHASRLGLHAEAADAYTRLASLVPGEPSYRQLATSERTAASTAPPPMR